MTQSELDAGVRAVQKIAEAHGISGYFSLQNYQEIAGRVIEAYVEQHTKNLAAGAAKVAAAAEAASKAHPPSLPQKK